MLYRILYVEINHKDKICGFILTSKIFDFNQSVAASTLLVVKTSPFSLVRALLFAIIGGHYEVQKDFKIFLNYGLKPKFIN